MADFLKQRLYELEGQTVGLRLELLESKFREKESLRELKLAEAEIKRMSGEITKLLAELGRSRKGIRHKQTSARKL